jgi:WD40 repeat protein
VTKYEFDKYFYSETEMAVVDDSQVLVTLKSTEPSAHSEQRCLALFFFDGKQLQLQWRVDMDGVRPFLSPVYDGTHVLVAAKDQSTVDLWNIQTRVIEKQYKRQWKKAGAHYAMTTVQGQRYVVGGYGGGIAVWHAERATEVVTSEEPEFIPRFTLVNPQKPWEFITHTEDDDTITLYDFYAI